MYLKIDDDCIVKDCSIEDYKRHRIQRINQQMKRIKELPCRPDNYHLFLESPFENPDESKKITQINCVICYPISKAPTFKFTATYGLILYAHNIAYQLMYKI